MNNQFMNERVETLVKFLQKIAPGGYQTFFTENTVGDEMILLDGTDFSDVENIEACDVENIEAWTDFLDSEGIEVWWCPGNFYLEIFGLEPKEEEELERYNYFGGYGIRPSKFAG